MGYQSVVGTANKIVQFEEQGHIRGELLAELAAVLGIDQATVDRLIQEDRSQFLQEWNAWADKPVAPQIVFRAIPGIFCVRPVPEHLKTTQEIEDYAADFARRIRKQTWLVLSRRRRIRFDEDGTKREAQEAVPGQPNGPWMRLAGGKRRFLFAGDFGIRPLDEPERREPGDEKGTTSNEAV